MFTIFTEIDQKTGGIKRPRWITYNACTQGIENFKNYGNYSTFSISKSQKHNKMLVEEFTVNTKDQGTVNITFEESERAGEMRDKVTFYYAIWWKN